MRQATTSSSLTRVFISSAVVMPRTVARREAEPHPGTARSVTRKGLSANGEPRGCPPEAGLGGRDHQGAAPRGPHDDARVAEGVGSHLAGAGARSGDPHEGLRVVAGVSARSHAPDIADLNWRRLAPMRRAIVHGLGSEPDARELRATGVDIRHMAGRAADALLLAGWLHGSLGWSSAEVPRIEESGDPAEALIAMLKGGNWTVKASMDDRCVKVTGTTQTPFEVLLPRETEAERVAAELRSLGADTALHAAVRAAAILAQ